jgi:hypothetical protein
VVALPRVFQPRSSGALPSHLELVRGGGEEESVDSSPPFIVTMPLPVPHTVLLMEAPGREGEGAQGESRPAPVVTIERVGPFWSGPYLRGSRVRPMSRDFDPRPRPTFRVRL